MNPQTEHVQCNYCSSTKRTLLFPDFDLAPQVTGASFVVPNAGRFTAIFA